MGAFPFFLPPEGCKNMQLLYLFMQVFGLRNTCENRAKFTNSYLALKYRKDKRVYNLLIIRILRFLVYFPLRNGY